MATPIRLQSLEMLSERCPWLEDLALYVNPGGKAEFLATGNYEKGISAPLQGALWEVARQHHIINRQVVVIFLPGSSAELRCCFRVGRRFIEFNIGVAGLCFGTRCLV